MNTLCLHSQLILSTKTSEQTDRQTDKQANKQNEHIPKQISQDQFVSDTTQI